MKLTLPTMQTSSASGDATLAGGELTHEVWTTPDIGAGHAGWQRCSPL